MHCATQYDAEKYERTMHRTTIESVPGEQVAAA
jgi:hypothetical protein